MLVETIRHDDLPEAQHSVATLLRNCFGNIVPALQRCVALKIIVANCPVQQHIKQQRRRTKATKTSLKKVNLRYFKLYPTYSNSFNLSNDGKFFWS